MEILVLNSGSSSQKACLYEIGETVPDHPPVPLWQGKIEWSGTTAAILVKNSQGVTFKEELPTYSREQAQANTAAGTTNASVAQKDSFRQGERAASESGIN